VSQGGENERLTPVDVTNALPDAMLTVPMTVADAVVAMRTNEAAASAAAEPPNLCMVSFQYNVSLVKTVLSSLRFP